MERKLVIAIDPAQRSGVAAFDGARFRWVGTVTSDPLDVMSKRHTLVRALCELDVPITRSGSVIDARVELVVEDQYIRFASAAKCVIEAAAAWQVLGSLLGLVPCEPVLPDEWAKTFALPKGATRAPAAKALVNERYPGVLYGGLMEQRDQVVAILIGLHHQIQTSTAIAQSVTWPAQRRAVLEQQRKAKTRKVKEG